MGLPQTDEEIVKLAESVDMVFVATVTEVVRREWLDGDDAFRRFEWKARVKVTEPFRGPEEGVEIEFWTSPSTCAAAFRLSSSYLFFITISQADGRPHTGQCTSYRYTPRSQGGPIPKDPNRGRIMQAIWALRSAFP